MLFWENIEGPDFFVSILCLQGQGAFLSVCVSALFGPYIILVDRAPLSCTTREGEHKHIIQFETSLEFLTGLLCRIDRPHQLSSVLS